MTRTKPLEDQPKTDMEQEEANETPDPLLSNGDVPPLKAPNSPDKYGTRIKPDTGTQSMMNTMTMNWEKLNPQRRRDTKNRKLHLK